LLEVRKLKCSIIRDSRILHSNEKTTHSGHWSAVWRQFARSLIYKLQELGLRLSRTVQTCIAPKRTYEQEAWPSEKHQINNRLLSFRAANMTERNLPPAFVTYGWCRTACIVSQSLGQHGVDVHVGDASPLAMSRFSKYCKSFTKLPDFFLQPDEYFDQVCEALKKTGAKVLLPCHEDVRIFCKYKDALPSDVHVMLPDWTTYNMVEDKFSVIEFVRKCGFPVPFTAEVTSLAALERLSQSIGWPAVIKTKVGNSAKGVRIVCNKEELFENFQELVQRFELPRERWPIIQQFLPGEAAGVCVLYDKGQYITAFAERYLRCKEPGKFGTSTLRETFDNESLISTALQIMNNLRWHGIAHLDFISDKEGQFRLIEINPRLWGALALAVFSGIDFPYLWYSSVIGNLESGIFTPQIRKIKCRWIIGDCLALLELIRRRKFEKALEVLLPEKQCYHDDFNWRDPLPLIFEGLDYCTKFVRSRGSLNPTTRGMIR